MNDHSLELFQLLNDNNIEINDEQAKEILAYLKISKKLEEQKIHQSEALELQASYNNIPNSYLSSDQWNKIPIGATELGKFSWDATQHGSLALINVKYFSKIVDVFYHHMKQYPDKYDIYYCKNENANDIATFIKLMNFAYFGEHLTKKETIIFIEDVDEVIKDLNTKEEKEDFLEDLSNLCNISREKTNNKIAVVMNMPQRCMNTYFNNAALKTITFDGSYYYQHISKDESPFKFYPSPQRYINITFRRHFKAFEIDRLFGEE